MVYSKTDWTNNVAPFINETNLDKLEAGVDYAHKRLDEATVYVDTTATGDGITNDGGVINAIQATAANKVLQFGAKTYAIGSVIRPTASSVTWRGMGMWRTTLKAISGATGLIDTPSTPASNLVFEDMCFDGSELVSILLRISGKFFPNCTFRRCRFTGGGQASQMIQTNFSRGLTVEDCLFHSPGTGFSNAIYGSFGATNMRIRRNDFMYVGRALAIWTDVDNQNGDVAQDIDFSNNYCDGGWYLLKAAYQNSGGTVTYTATTLTDTAAAFSGLSYGPSASGQTVRIMPTLASGGFTSQFENNELTDATATFVTAGVKRGDIVRATNGTENSWNTVEAVESETVLRTEDWKDAETYYPVAPPPSGGSPAWTYTVYRTLIGEVASFTGTVITVLRWHDLEGNATTPTNGTRYEVLTGKPASASFNAGEMRTCGPFTEGARRMTVRNNRIRRSHNDQIALQGSIDSIVDGNFLIDGRDMGMTLDSSGTNISRRTLVTNNYAYHNGISGYSIQGEDHWVIGNYSQDNTWRLVTAGNGDNYRIGESARTHFISNVSHRTNTNMALNLYGMALQGNGVDLVLIGNKQYGYVTAGVRLKATQPNLRIINNTGSVLDEFGGGWIRDFDDRYSFNFQAFKSTTAIAETVPKGIITNGLPAAVAGNMYFHGISLPKDRLITSITFVSGNVAAAGVSNLWFAIYDGLATPFNRLGYTADQGATTWAVNSEKTLNLTTPFRTTYDGRYYLAIMVNATTMPTYAGTNLPTGLQGLQPRNTGLTNVTGQTTGPPATTVTSLSSGTNGWLYAYVS